MPSQESVELTDRITNQVLNKIGNPDAPPEPQFNIPEPDLFPYADILTKGKPELAPEEKAPGFFENLAAHAIEQNEFLAASRFLGNTFDPNDPVGGDVPYNWHPYEEANIADLPPNLWDYVLESKSPAQLEYRRNKALEQAKLEERLNQGGIVSSLAGGAVGIATSPSTYFFPMGAAARYGEFGLHLSKGLLKVAPGLAANVVAHEGVVQLGRLGGNLEDFALNSVRDTAFGLAFYGAGRGLVFGAKAMDVWQARRVVNLSNAGITADVKITPGGEYDGLVARAIPGANVSDAELKIAQEFLDNRAVLRGLSSVIGPIGKIPGFGSDLIKGMTSPFATVRKFTNRMGNQSVVTGAIEGGAARLETAEEIVNKYARSARQAAMDINNLYLESRGVAPGFTQSSKQVVQTLFGSRDYTKEKFFTDVLRVVYTGEDSAIGAVNKAAKVWIEHSDSLWETFLQVNNYPKNVVRSKFGANYGTRIYKLGDIIGRPIDWENLVITKISEQDAQITNWLRPISTIQDRIKVLRQELKAAPKAKERPIRNSIAREQRRLKVEGENLQKAMRDGLVDPILLAEQPWVTSAELDELKNLFKPITKIDTTIKNLREELPGLERHEMKASRLRIKELKAQKAKLYEGLVEDARTGKISNKLWYEQEGKIKFHSGENLEFRERYSSTEAMRTQAQAWAAAITNNTPEQLAQGFFGPGGAVGATPSVARMRTVHLKDIDLLDGGFLTPNIEHMILNYSKSLGKRIALKETFADMDWRDGPIDLVKALTLETDMRKKNIIDNTPEGPKQQKALNKLDSQTKKAKDFMQNYYNYFMGNTVKNSVDARFRRAARNWTSITMLSGVPLLQGGELAGMIFKQRLWPFISGGLVPAIETINSKIKRGNFVAHAEHSGMAIEIELNKFSSGNFDSSIPHDLGVPVNLVQRLERYLERTSGVAQSIFGTTWITNRMQTLSAGITQSRVMGDLIAHTKGKLGKADIERLLINGIDPKEAKLYIAESKKAGGYQGSMGGYESYWYNWENPRLRDSMRRAIVNDIEGSILQAGLFDKPLWMKDSVIGMPFQFLGYVYAAFNKFTIPFAQSPDLSRVLGLVVGAGYGMMTEPLRAFVRGRPYELDDEKALDQWIYEGFSQSGILGFPIELINMANALLDIPYLNRYKQSRLKRRSALGILAGPTGGLIDNIFMSANMFLDGRFSQQGVSQFLHTLPIPIMLGMDRGLTEALKHTGLSEKRSDALPYSWRDKD